MTDAPVRKLYVPAVIVLGTAAILTAVIILVRHPPALDFYYLAALTIVSGFLPIKVPKVSASISVSETFVYAGTLLLGAPAGVLLVVFDALVIWIKLWATEKVNPRRLAFSLSASALAIGIAGLVLFVLLAVPPLGSLTPDQRPSILRFTLGLLAFSTTYFLLNTSFVALAISLEVHGRPYAIWRANFAKLWLNYLAGASLAMLLVYQSQGVNPAFLVVIIPLVLVMFLTYRQAALQIQEAERHLEQMNRTFLQTIEAFAMAVDAKDQVTHGHIRRVQRYTMEMAAILGIDNPKLLEALRAAALLHDTGKLAIPEYILNKPGRLSGAEYDKMKLHAAIGADILKSIDFPYPIEPIVRHHHENWDGTGYPAGLKGQEIPIGARILSVVDCYDAIRSDRPYRRRMTREEAVKVMRERRGTMYDPTVLDVFLENLDRLEALESADDAHELSASLSAIASARELPEVPGGGTRDVGSRMNLASLLLAAVSPSTGASAMALFFPQPGNAGLVVESAAGSVAASLQGLRLPAGGGISGWVFANRKSALNSEAALDLGQLAREGAEPLEFAASAPVIDGADCPMIATMYGAKKFTSADEQLLSSAAATLYFGARAAAQPVAAAAN